MTELKFEDACFNVGHYRAEIEAGLTEHQFIEDRLQEKVYADYSEPDRRTLLKMVYELLRGG